MVVYSSLLLVKVSKISDNLRAHTAVLQSFRKMCIFSTQFLIVCMPFAKVYLNLLTHQHIFRGRVTSLFEFTNVPHRFTTNYKLQYKICIRRNCLQLSNLAWVSQEWSLLVMEIPALSAGGELEISYTSKYLQSIERDVCKPWTQSQTPKNGR